MLVTIIKIKKMKRINQIEKEINTLLDEVNDIILTTNHQNKFLADSMLIILKRKVKDQFINIKHYLK